MTGLACLQTLPQTMPAPAQPCVWMSARVLGFKLCDRDFDCQHCPLNAALAGAPWLSATTESGDGPATTVGFPQDRLYTPGHTWFARADATATVARVGLDAFAASLLGGPRRARRRPDGRIVGRGETLCELDLDEGVLPIGAPVPGRICAWNTALSDGIDALTADPYGEGWIAELEVGPQTPTEELFGAGEALRRARLDAARFCRGAALRMLSQPRRWGDLPASRVCGVTDLHRVLGADSFLQLLRDLVH